MHQMVLLNNGIASNTHTYTQIESKIKSVATEKESGGYGHEKGRKQTHSHHLLFWMHAHKVSRRILVKCSCELQQISVQLISKCVCVCVRALCAILSYILAFETRLEHFKLVSF